MSNQQVIYSSLRFLQSPAESPNRLRPGGNQRAGHTDGKGMLSASLTDCQTLTFEKKCLSVL